MSINGEQTNGLSDVDAFRLIHAASDSVTLVVERGVSITAAVWVCVCVWVWVCGCESVSSLRYVSMHVYITETCTFER